MTDPVSGWWLLLIVTVVGSAYIILESLLQEVTWLKTPAR